MTDKPPRDYEIVAFNYADLLRSLGKARKANALEERLGKDAAVEEIACARSRPRH